METKGGDFYLGKIWGWVFPPAQVRQSPNCIPHHSQTVLFSQQPENENVTSLEHLLNSIAVLKQMAAWLTVLKREEYCSPGHSPCTQCCHLQYCLKPTLPTVEKDNHKVSPIFFIPIWDYFCPFSKTLTCPCTSSKSEQSISMKMGTAPAWMTTRVWWDVPEAMLVRTHAASNCRDRTSVTILQKSMHYSRAKGIQ